MRMIDIIEDLRYHRSPADVVRACIADSEASPKFINNGWCFGFASKLARMLGPDAKVVSTTGHHGVFPGHSVVLYGTRYYDAEDPEGVTDLRDLTYSKRILSSMDGEIRDRRSTEQRWPQAPSSAGLIRIMTANGVVLTRAARDQIRKFSHFTLSNIPIACLNIHGYAVTKDQIDKFLLEPFARPPVIFDEAHETIVEGLKHAALADGAGFSSVRGYVGDQHDLL